MDNVTLRLSKMTRRAVLAGATAGSLSTFGGEAQASTGKFDGVSAYLDAGYRSLGLPGASLLIWRRGKTLYERYFGDYTADTVVPIASSSKWLAAAVLMTLVDDGLIGLDKPLSTYLPQFVGKKGEMTIRQMFAHTSGLVDPGGEGDQWDYAITMAQYADRIARDGVLRADPGVEFRYGSVSMQLVGAVAEQVTGKSWNDLFLERIAKPCDMPNTAFAKVAANRNPMLAGGASSSLPDYVPWAACDLGGVGARDAARPERRRAHERRVQRPHGPRLPLWPWRMAGRSGQGWAAHSGEQSRCLWFPALAPP